MSELSYNDKSLIVGLGATGFSVARFLNYKNISFFVADSREHPADLDTFKETFPEVEVKLGEFNREDFSAAKNIVLSPGVPLSTSAVQYAAEQGVPVIGDIELFARDVDSKKSVIAITGSNGKSTVTTLIAEMLMRSGFAVAKGGNLGPPALDLITSVAAVDFYVLELSSFQLETTSSLQLAASTILNISEDHLDRYASLEEYIRAKQRIHSNAKTIVVNREEKFDIAAAAASEIISFGLDQGKNHHFGVMQTQRRDWIACGDKPWLACGELSSLPGVSGVLNAQAALAIGHTVGLPQTAMVETLKEFKGLPHRMQSLGLVQGVEWINDSKATNVAATCAALSTINQPYVWIAGGDGKAADFSRLINSLNENLKCAFLFGRDAELIAKALESASPRPQFKVVSDLDSAVQQAMQLTTAGDCILLSPACSSLDSYTSYIERGNHFMRLFQEQTCKTG